MKIRQKILLTIYSVALASSCRTSGPTAHGVTADDGGVVDPKVYKDPLVHLTRMPGSEFVEILEVIVGPDSRVFFCSGVQGLNVVDASAPDSLRRTYQLASGFGDLQFPRCQHLATAGDLAYYSNKGDEVQPSSFVSMWDMTKSPPMEIDAWRPEGVTIEGIAAQGNFLYAAVHEKGLKILERTDAGLLLRGTTSGLSNAWHVAIFGDYAFVADRTQLVVVNVSNPAASEIVGRVALGGTGQSVAIDSEGHRVYVAMGQSGFAIVDVTSKTEPKLLGVADTDGTAVQVAVDGDRVAVADWNDVRVYDVSAPASPVLRATETIASGGPFSRVLGVAMRDDVVYAGEWSGFHSLRYYSERSAPDVYTVERSIEFGSVSGGERDAIAVIVGNRGTEPLVAWQLEVSEPFTLDHSEAVIEPGALEVFELLFSPSDNSLERGSLRIFSDDPDEQPMSLLLTANRPGIGAGDLAPDVSAQVLGGGPWALSDHRGEVVLLAYFATF